MTNEIKKDQELKKEQELKKKAREAARNNYQDDDFKIYDDARVLECEDGCWVEAYVWVAR